MEKRQDKSDVKPSSKYISLEYGGEATQGAGSFARGGKVVKLTTQEKNKIKNLADKIQSLEDEVSYSKDECEDYADNRELLDKYYKLDSELYNTLKKKYGDNWSFKNAYHSVVDEYARGGGVPKEFGGRYNGVYNNIGRDVEMDKEWVAKPVGYRFTDKLAKRLGVSTSKKPTQEQIEKYRGKGVYFENREDKSDIKPSNRYPSYMSGGTTDGSWVSAYARGGVERIANINAREYSENMIPFKANNLEGKTLSNGDYVVLSYGYYPLWYYNNSEKQWYGNSTKYSVSTSKQFSQSRPTHDAKMVSRDELEKIMMGHSTKFENGGAITDMLGSIGTNQNVGGTAFSTTDLTSHMDLSNPNF
jgi:hypothetical protein